jgi:hypothetical protein
MAQKLAVIGAGPIGIEAAALAVRLGWQVSVYEAALPGSSIERWQHVRLFSSWALNQSPWGREILACSLNEDDYPTGREYLDHYLLPLAQTLGEVVKTHTRVFGITRRDALKGDFIGARDAKSGPFLLHIAGPAGESYVEADVIFDTTGVYENPAKLGTSGLRAIGEDSADDRIERYIPDAMGNDEATYAGKSVLLLGAGHSAVTSLKLLSDLHEKNPKTRIFWAFRGNQAPYQVIENDSLPQRKSLGEFGNTAASGEIAGVTPLPETTVDRIQNEGDGLIVTLRRGAVKESLHVDRIVANVGYQPDLSLNRELQVHQCYASEGPMKLAASLLASAGGDCLAQAAVGVDLLKNPEPNYFVMGAKSYGRNSSFLLRLGIEQIQEILGFLKV